MSDRTAEVFDAGAARFDAIYGDATRLWDRLTRENVLWRFHETLATAGDVRGKRVLDVGCGPGRYCAELAARGAVVTGVDFAPAMVELARSMAKAAEVGDRCTFVASDALAFRAAQKFDLVIANGFFDYAPDPVATLRHLRTLTGGKLIATFPLLWAFRVPFRKLWRMTQRCYLRFYTPRAIEDACTAAGFTIERLEKHGPIAFVVAARQP